MDSDGLPIVGSGVDYTKVGPFHQKRTLTFLNHFLIHTTSFLNHFSTICDEKLENLLVRIQRLEASMCILEAKLASIPGLEDVALNNPEILSPSSENPHPYSSIPETPVAQSEQDASVSENQPTKVNEPEKQSLKISQDSRFAKYFKMVNMGVPEAAVKLKMKTEGVNPDILDDPDAEAPPGDPGIVSKSIDDDSDNSDLSD